MKHTIPHPVSVKLTVVFSIRGISGVCQGNCHEEITWTDCIPFVRERIRTCTCSPFDCQLCDTDPGCVLQLVCAHHWVILSPVGNQYRKACPLWIQCEIFKGETLKTGNFIRSRRQQHLFLCWNSLLFVLFHYECFFSWDFVENKE